MFFFSLHMQYYISDAWYIYHLLYVGLHFVLLLKNVDTIVAKVIVF